jgi:hypothetical protein
VAFWHGFCEENATGIFEGKDLMNSMLANKYLVDGQIQQAIELFESDLPVESAPLGTLYSLLVCYSLAGRCADAAPAAGAILRREGALDLARIRDYRLRFTEDLFRRGRLRFTEMCRNADRRAAVHTRLVLAVLLDDAAEIALCEQTLREFRPEE